MDNNNLEQLKKLAQVFNVDKLISPEEINQVLESIVAILATYKKETQEINENTRQAVESLLSKVETEHDKYLEETKSIAQEAKFDTTEALNKAMLDFQEVKRMCKEVMDSKPENGKDADEDKIIEEVLAQIKLPEYKETVLDDGGQIVDKINSLPVNEENQIDAKHIKNLPVGKDGRVISGGVTRKVVQQMIDASGGGTPGGSTTQLQYNNAGAFGGISGATTNGTITTFTAGNLVGADVKASGSGGLSILSNSGTQTSLHGAGGGANNTFYGGMKGDYLTPSEMVITDASKNIISAPVATYPSLTELSYVKGVTSAIQTQLNAKQGTISFGTGVETALGVNVGTAGSPVVNGGALGTPSSGTVTNLTGTASININGTVGATTPTTGSFTTVTTSGNIELGNASDTTLSRSAAGTLAVEGIRVKTTTPLVVSASSYTTDTGTSLNMDNLDIFVITAQAGALLFNAPGGTLVQGRSLIIRIKDNGTSRSLTYNAIFRAIGVTLPTATTVNKTTYLGFFYNSSDTKWDCVAVATEA